MIDRERQPEQTLENKEYSFENGVQESVLRIQRILESQGSVIVAIIGSGVDVGKTTISSRIGKSLIEKGIPVKWCGDIDTLTFESQFPTHGEVLILHAESPYTKDTAIEIKAKMFELSFSKIDLRVFVYRPDKPFFNAKEKEPADIIIKNEGAINKR